MNREVARKNRVSRPGMLRVLPEIEGTFFFFTFAINRDRNRPIGKKIEGK